MSYKRELRRTWMTKTPIHLDCWTIRCIDFKNQIVSIYGTLDSFKYYSQCSDCGKKFPPLEAINCSSLEEVPNYLLEPTMAASL